MGRHDLRIDALGVEQFLSARATRQPPLHFAADETIYRQSDPANALYYIERGWVKTSVVAPNGKEVVTALRGDGELIGVRCILKDHLHFATATAITDCTLVRTSSATLIRLLRNDADFAEAFPTYLARQGLRREQGLIDYLTNSTEWRLAQTLLWLASPARGDESQHISTRVNQTDLANMIGTTRSRVSYFMNRFRQQGLIEYDRNGQVRVRNERLSEFLRR